MTRPTLLLCAILVAAPLDSAAAQAPPDNQAPTTAALREVHETLVRRRGMTDDDPAAAPLYDRTKAALRRAEPGLAEIPITPEAPPKFSRLALNGRRAGCDALRFRFPRVGLGYQIFVDVVIAAAGKDESNLDKIGLLTPEPSPYFYWFHHDQPFRDPDANSPLPRDNAHFALRLLMSDQIAAGTDALVWFDFKTDEPTPLFVRVRVEPMQPVAPPETPALVQARATLQDGLRALAERYDADTRANRRKYLDALDRAVAATNRREVVRLRAEADRVNRGDSAASDPRGFHIVRAEYGEGPERWLDVTIPLRDLIRRNILVYEPGENARNGLRPDPSPGTRKTLLVIYTVDGVPGVSKTRDDERLVLPPSARIK